MNIISYDSYYPVIQVGDITVVGESHNNRTSKELLEDILEDENPDCVGVELGFNDIPWWEKDSSGISYAIQYSNKHGLPLCTFDISRYQQKEALGKDFRKAAEIVNSICPNSSLGTFRFSDIVSFREQLFREMPDAFTILYEFRERYMNRILESLSSRFDSVVAVVGVTHLPAITVNTDMKGCSSEWLEKHMFAEDSNTLVGYSS